MIKLRYYQQGAIDALYEYMGTRKGNPIVDTPTGSGKSVILAGFIHRALQDDPGTRIIVLTHVKELVEQDAKAILRYWPEAPLGIWSAGLGRKTRAQITVASIQSIWRDPTLFSPADLVIIDECHLLSKKADTTYRRFLAGLTAHNPKLRVIGLSATPYRMDSGLLTEGKDRIFTDIAYSANVADLIEQGFLSPLISKAGLTRANLDGIKMRGKDFLPAALADRMDKVELITGAVEEIIAYGHDRKSWLLFCSGVQHAQHVADCLNHYGITAAMICGDTPTGERDRIIADFKAGKIKALTNADVLTTGFDYPDIDLIAMLRPTKSTGLYVQIVGRGLRPVYAPGYDLETQEGRTAAIANGTKKNCLVLDFANNVATHGPIDCIAIKPRTFKDEPGLSVAPVKECPSCHSLVHASIMVCPECQHEWPQSAKHDAEASDAPLLSNAHLPRLLPVKSVSYMRHVKLKRPPVLCASYVSGNLTTVSEYIPIEDPRPEVRKFAVMWFWKRGLMCPKTVDEALAMHIPCPTTITVIPDGRYTKITQATFNHV